MILKLGRKGTLSVVVGLSVLLSLGATTLTGHFVGWDMTPSVIALAIGVPLGVAPLVTWQIITLVDKLHRLERQQAEASRAKSDFLASMSHEIRTPLSGVLGLTMLALEERGVDSTHDYLVKIHKSAEHLLSVINSILDFSKIEARKVTLEAIPVQLLALLEAQTKLIAVQTQGRDVQVTFQAQPGCPQWVLADPVRLAQVATNLLSNAVKFTVKGRVTMRLERLSGDSNTSELRLSVEDTGIGMGPEVLGRLFGRYTQADATVTRRFGGTGLGLMISKGLVELMGGRLDVSSTPGVGTCFAFTVTLPVTSPPPPSSEPTDDWRSRFTGRRVLLAEDNLVNQLVSRKLLEKFGFEVTVVADGQQAVSAALDPSARFDVVLMDVEMPVLDGLEATRRIRQQVSSTALPIVALTANAFEHDRVGALAAGMNGYVAKPIEIAHLDTVLCGVMRGAEPGD